MERLIWGALMPGVRTEQSPDWLAHSVAQGVESVCLFGDSVGTVARTSRSARQLRELTRDLLIATDEEGGDVTRLQAQQGSSFLSPLALGVIDDTEVTRAQARLLGSLLRSVGLDWTLAPVADINVDPLNPVIGVRSFGSDAALVARHVAAAVEGFQCAGVNASVKHFPGHGDTHVDSHESLPALTIDEALLLTREVEPFRAAIAADAASVMTGHLLVLALDESLPASLSPAITDGLLRTRLGYQGVVITDAVEMGAVAGADRRELPSAVVRALEAGADVVCLGADRQEEALLAAVAAVKHALEDGRLTVERLRDAARRRAQLRGTEPAELDLDADARLVAGAALDSVRVVGDAHLTGAGVDVLRIVGRPGYAAGQTGWGVIEPLRGAGADVREVDDCPTETARDLVIEVRDPWKDEAILTAVTEALRQRPDAVVIDAGWPADRLPDARGVIRTHGAGRLSSVLAAAVLLGRDGASDALACINDALLEMTA